jgi:addiction module RelE/StbE family toxin
MKIQYSKEYYKDFKKLDKRSREAVNSAVLLFEKDPFNRVLRNHALKGRRSGFRSIDAGFDLRIIFREEGGYTIVFFVEVGTHSQIYG